MALHRVTDGVEYVWNVSCDRCLDEEEFELREGVNDHFTQAVSQLIQGGWKIIKTRHGEWDFACPSCKGKN